MMYLGSQAGAVSFRAKIALFVSLVWLQFIILDITPLISLYNQLKFTHIQETQLNEVRNFMLTIYIAKTVWAVIISGIIVGFAYWIIKPYKSE